MTNDKTEADKRDELIYELSRSRFERVAENMNKLNDQARSLTSSILVVIGFLLASGTTSIVDAQTMTANLFFIGVVTLIVSVLFSYFSIRIRPPEVIPDYKDLLEYHYKSYEQILNEVGGEMSEKSKYYEVLSTRKLVAIRFAWILLIFGLFSVMSFIVLSIVVR